MKIEEILQLVDSVSKSALAEFKYEEGGVKLSLKKAAAVQSTAADAVIYTHTHQQYRRYQQQYNLQTKRHRQR